jgi:type I restriction enzyme S subunit
VKHPRFIDDMVRKATGASYPAVSDRIVRESSIPLPALSEQRRIAAILDKADALRAKRREAIAKLDQLLQSVFLDMFGDGRASTYPVVPLQEAFWFQEGPGVRKWQFRESGVKLLNVGNIEKDGSINLDKTDRHVSVEEAHGKYKHFLVDEGDLVIASSGISFDADGMLRTRGGFILKHHLPLCMNTSTIRFKEIEKKSSLRYLQAWINSRGFRAQITKLVTGSAQQNFGPSHLRQLAIPLPPLVDQHRFCDVAEKVGQQRRTLQGCVEQQNTLFASLQHRAFSGTL